MMKNIFIKLILILIIVSCRQSDSAAKFLKNTTNSSRNNNFVEVKKDTLPYFKLPNYPEKYTAESVVARMIDAVGFRFYWATEALRSEDLSYKPSAKARTSEESIDHILGLSNIILNSCKNQINTQNGEEISSLSFEIKRKKVLENLKTASDLLKSGTLHLENLKIVFKNGNKTQEFPFWNQINGPISDALWHIGQVVSFRRSSGNPFNSKVDVFLGKLRD